ncbi:formin-like protein 3 [Pyrgilauda ruficollis]|uniref:formin-like protein 3 n=1 Tax=Pyrgilauda ruficollis TaxID=221976 RepID=UPI001B8632D5|nr:formin-like protein 3 [Pyrgilauda ruficollis]
MTSPVAPPCLCRARPPCRHQRAPPPAAPAPASLEPGRGGAAESRALPPSPPGAPAVGARRLPREFPRGEGKCSGPRAGRWRAGRGGQAGGVAVPLRPGPSPPRRARRAGALPPLRRAGAEFAAGSGRVFPLSLPSPPLLAARVVAPSGSRPGPALTLARRGETRVRLPCPPAPLGREGKQSGAAGAIRRPAPCRKLLRSRTGRSSSRARRAVSGAEQRYGPRSTAVPLLPVGWAHAWSCEHRRVLLQERLLGPCSCGGSCTERLSSKPCSAFVLLWDRDSGISKVVQGERWSLEAIYRASEIIASSCVL